MSGQVAGGDMTATERLLEFAATEHRLPQEARVAAERLIPDTLAVGAASGSGRARPSSSLTR